MLRRVAIQIAGLVIALTGASAWAGEGGYLRGSLGATELDGDMEFFVTEQTDGNDDAVFAGTTELDTGAVVSLHAGYMFSSGLAWEVEFAYAKNDIDALGLYEFGSGPVDTSGTSVGDDVTSMSLLWNLFYNFNLDGSWQPYVGGGAGLTNVEWDFTASDGVDSVGEKLEDNVFAYQLFGGLRWQFHEHMNVFAQYNYLQADGLTDTANSANPLVGPNTRVDLDADYRMHSLRVGFGYQF